MKRIIEYLKNFVSGSPLRRRILYVAAGGLGGFAYYYFIGCRTGACPISGNPWVSTTYGGVVGFVLTLGNRQKVS